MRAQRLMTLISVLFAGAIVGVSVSPTAQVTIANNASEMSGKIVMLADGGTARTVTNLFTFNRSGSTPFSVQAGSATVPNLLNWSTVSITTTGSQNNFAPGLVGNTELRWTGSSDLTITGFSSPVDGQHVRITNLGSANIFFAHASTSSTLGNRLSNYITSASNTPVGLGGSAEYFYSSAANTWILVSHFQGAAISFTPAITFGGAAVGITYGAQTGTYVVVNRTVTIDVRVALTNKGSSVGAASITGLPFTVSGTPISGIIDFAVGGAGMTGAPYGVPNGTSIILSQTSATVRGSLTDANFTNTTDIRASAIYQAS